MASFVERRVGLVVALRSHDNHALRAQQCMACRAPWDLAPHVRSGQLCLLKRLRYRNVSPLPVVALRQWGRGLLSHERGAPRRFGMTSHSSRN
eukprot:3939845-Pyramimonas_sp.AAC.1